MKINYKKLIWLGAFFLFLGPVAVHASALEFTSPGFDQAANIATSSAINNIPWEWEALTPVYSYSFDNPGAYDPSRPMTIKINYPKTNSYFKQIFVLDELSGIWQPLKTQDVPEKKYATATTTSTSGKLIILSNHDILTV